MEGAAETKPRELSKEERELEQKMVKVISKMPDKIQNRFKILHMLSDQRSKINDLFEEEVKTLTMKFEQKKKPTLEKRDNILRGEVTEFDELVTEYDKREPLLKEIVDGIQAKKSEEDKEEDAEEAEKHEKTDVSHLKDKQGVPDFWAKAIEGHPMLMQIITEKDKPII